MSSPPMSPTRNRFFVISGPSGVGKGTVCRYLLSAVPGLAVAVSVTSRARRPGEQEGVDYFFVSREKFEAMVAEEAFLEWAEYNGNYYGTPCWYVEKLLSEGQQVLLEIDVQGALQVKKKYPNACLIFIEPPSMTALEERLRGRGTNDDADIQRRLAISQHEMTLRDHFTHRVINADLQACQQTAKSLFI